MTANSIFDFGDKIKLENIIFVSKSVNRQVLSLFHDSFAFLGNEHRYETYWSINDHLHISAIRAQM